MARTHDEVISTGATRTLHRRQLVRLLAAGMASGVLGLQVRPGAAMRRRHRSGWLGGTLHQHKDNPTAHPSHPIHRIGG